MKRSAGVWVGAALLLAACGGGRSSHTAATSPPTSAAETVTTASSGPTTSPASTTEAPKSSTGGSTATTAAASAAGSATPAAPAPTVAGTPNKPGTSSAQPAAAGLYKYKQSGSSTVGASSKPVPPEGTLKIDAAQSNGNQVDHRAVDPSQPPSDQVFSFRNGGIFLVQTVMRSNNGGQEQDFTCNFNPPLPTPPWPPRVGETYSGAANCGSFTVQVQGKVTGTKDVDVQGTTHHTFILDSNLTFQGQLQGSGTEVDWADPATSLILHQESTTKATYSGFVSFSSSVTSDIESTKPS